MENYDVSKLILNESKRYESLDGYEYTSGSKIEFLLKADDGDKWIETSVEHNGVNYYLVGYEETAMAELKVRRPVS